MFDWGKKSSKNPAAPRDYTHITLKCFVHAPFQKLLEGLLELFLRHKIQPEICIDATVLAQYRSEDFKQVAAAFKKAGLACTIHAPFLGLDPASPDQQTRRVAMDILQETFDLIGIFAPQSIVCHPHLIADRPEDMKERLKAGIDFWQELLPTATKHKTPIMLENTFEKSPANLKQLLTALGSPYARFCLDAGHVNAFAKSHWQDWLPEMAPWLGQLHLHDNNGEYDDHEAIGSGCFDFAGFFGYLKEHRPAPIFTLEPHEETALWGSLAALDKLEYFNKQ